MCERHRREAACEFCVHGQRAVNSGVVIQCNHQNNITSVKSLFSRRAIRQPTPKIVPFYKCTNQTSESFLIALQNRWSFCTLINPRQCLAPLHGADSATSEARFSTIYSPTPKPHLFTSRKLIPQMFYLTLLNLCCTLTK